MSTHDAAADGDGPAPVALGSASGRWVLAATVGASGMAFLDSTVVNVALPTIGREFGTSLSGLQWIVNGYMLTLAALILLAGSLGDRYGRKHLFLIGVVWFALASTLCASATSLPMLILARVAQGMGAALLTPGSLALIEASFRRDHRARAIGVWSGMTGIATAIGPFVGGWLVDAGTWRFIFLLNVPLAVVVVAITRTKVAESRNPEAARHLDLSGAVLGAVGLGGLTYALIEAGTSGPSPAVIATGTTGLLALVVFVVVERTSSSPMVPPAVFASRQFTAANLVTVTVYAPLGAVFFLLVIYLQIALGYSALQAGAAELPVTALMLALSARSGQLAQRIGPRAQMSVGPVVVAAGVLMMTQIDPGDRYLTGVLPPVLVLGMGLAITVAPLTSTALAAAGDNYAGVASGINNTVARTAQLTAVAVVPLAAGITGDIYADPAAFVTGFHTAMVITAAVAAAGGVLAAATIRNPLAERALPAEPGRYQCGVDAPPLRTCPHSSAHSPTDT